MNRFSTTFIIQHQFEQANPQKRIRFIKNIFTTHTNIGQINSFIASFGANMNANESCLIFYLISSQLSNNERFNIKMSKDTFYSMVNTALQSSELNHLMRQLAEEDHLDKFIKKFQRYLLLDDEDEYKPLSEQIIDFANQNLF